MLLSSRLRRKPLARSWWASSASGLRQLKPAAARDRNSGGREAVASASGESPMFRRYPVAVAFAVTCAAWVALALQV
jgi:hypothetical protein